MAGSMVYRLKVAAPDQAYMQTFVSAMRTLQDRLDNRGFNFIGGLHGAPGWYCWHHQFNPRTAVQARLFLPWHRAYLWTLEQGLQDIDAAVALPWWDWTADRDIPPAYNAAQLGGQANPLRSFHMRVPATARNPAIDRDTVRSAGTSPLSRLPTAEEIDAVLDDTDWASFSDRLQSYHDDVHVWVGGDMSEQTTAGYDPIFYAHHCMIDRVWYLWQVRHGNAGFPSQLLDLPLVPFGKTARDVLDLQTLGYEYAHQAASLAIEGGGH